MSNPYDAPNTPGGPGGPGGADPAKARELVNVPSVLLIVTGALGALFALYGLVSGGNQLPAEIWSDPNLAQYRDTFEMLQKGGRFSNVLALLASGLTVFGALKMRNLEAWGLALAGSVLAMIPCLQPCCCIGLPIGIWAIVVLNKPEVKGAFR